MTGKARAYWRRMGLHSVRKEFQRELVRVGRQVTGKDRRKMMHYLAQPGDKKLVLGCGASVLTGWLNTDFEPLSDEVMYLNVTIPFPFADGTFDLIFTEHMIEHVSYADAERMLRECWRVMKAGSKIRVSTPDLKFLVDLYQDDKSPLQQEYLRYTAEEAGIKPLDTHIINLFVREWGHLFIYDEKALQLALEEAGFTEIERCALNESREPALRNIEHERRRPPGFLRLETLTLEGVKKSA